MAISPQQLTIYLYSAHRAVILAIAQLSCYRMQQTRDVDIATILSVHPLATRWYCVKTDDSIVKIPSLPAIRYDTIRYDRRV